MAASAARSFLRSSSLHSAARAARVTTSEARVSRNPFRLPKLRPRILRSSTMLSFCMDSFLPKHNATAAALMTSMLSLSMNGYGWLSKVGSDDV